MLNSRARGLLTSPGICHVDSEATTASSTTPRLLLALPLSAEGSICFVLLLKQLPTSSHSSSAKDSEWPKHQGIPQGYMERSGKAFCTTKPMLALWWFQEAEDTVSSLGMFVSVVVWWSG